MPTTHSSQLLSAYLLRQGPSRTSPKPWGQDGRPSGPSNPVSPGCRHDGISKQKPLGPHAREASHRSWSLLYPGLLTCTSCATDPMDVDLGESRGVVVDDHLHSGDVQAPGGTEHLAGFHVGKPRLTLSFPVLPCTRPTHLEATSVAIRIR